MPKSGPRPQCWIHPDPKVHEKYIPYLRKKSQAVYLGIEWDLTFEEFLEIWTEEAWAQRGRKVTCLNMIRIDQKGPWRKDNVELTTRLEMLRKKVKDKNDGK
jgi:hypothetical protein